MDPDGSVIRRIASWGAGAPTTSMYLDVDGLRHPRWPDVEQRAEHLFRSARRQARPADPDAETAVEADLAAFRGWLDRGLDRSVTRGVALFSRSRQGLFETVELAVPVRDQVVVDPEPDVAQLCAVASRSWSALAVAVDDERWRVALLEPDGRTRELDVLDDTMARNVDLDMEVAGLGHHEEELAREHFRRVARSVTAEMDAQPARRLVILGTSDAIAALEDYLPAHLSERIAGRAPLPAYSGTPEMVETARELVELAEQERRAAVLGTIRQRATTTGAAMVTGLDSTLTALGDELVATLVVEETFEAAGGRCTACRLLVAGSGPCPRCGGEVRASANVVDAAIADAFLHHGGLVPVEDGALSDLGRIAALVRPWAESMVPSRSGGAGRA